MVHGDELAMTMAHVFNVPGYSSHNNSQNPWLPNTSDQYDERERALAKEMLAYWSSFIKTNNPNTHENVSTSSRLRSLSRYRQKLSVKFWPEYKLPNATTSRFRFGKKPMDSQFIVFRVNGSEVDRAYHYEECHMWNSYIPTIYEELGRKKSFSLFFQN